ncbi:MAG: hypothetical protein H0T53_00435 [Herpetosiphonaceae bacterium]|nr:hypothetical protein [Herpetosiphonaceae bacterium]
MRRVVLIGLLLVLASCSFSTPLSTQIPAEPTPLPKQLTFILADPTQAIDQTMVDMSCDVFKRRLDRQKHLVFTVNCTPDMIEVGLSANADEQEIASLLTATGSIEFIDPKGEYLEEGTPICTTTYRVLRKTPGFAGESCETIYQTIAKDSQLLRDTVSLTTDQTGRPAVGFVFDGEGARALEVFTAANIGKPMSIVVDQRVLSSPMINGTLPGEGIITFGSSSQAEQEKEAALLLDVLKSGSLPIAWQVQK